MRDVILAIDDQEGVRQLLAQSLDDEDREIRCEAHPDDLHSLLASIEPALIIIDPAGQPDSPGTLLTGLREAGFDMPVIMLSSVTDLDLAVETMRAGAHDFLCKPIPLPRLLESVKEALAGTGPEQELLERRRLFRIGNGQNFYKSTSDAMTRVYDDALMVAMSGDTTTLITGESGTGKEVIAQLIHELSPRHEASFLELNCAAIPAELLESELFGHEAGAFTDAKESKAGLFEVANQGTIFLDEIGEMSMSLQVKLLRFLERKTFRRVGGTKDIEVDVRIISATNRDLRDMVAERGFREDLFYRLNVVPINLPPLRERREDILPLIAHFFGEFNPRFNKNFSSIDEDGRRMLMEHPWPGNIRELRNVVERVLLMEHGPELVGDQLRSHLSGDWEQVAESFARRLARLIEEPIPEEGVDLIELLRSIERKFIDKAYSQSNENQSQAAAMLKLGRDKLRYRMKQIGAGLDEGAEHEESPR